jgi:hypothetical protein
MKNVRSRRRRRILRREGASGSKTEVLNLPRKNVRGHRSGAPCSGRAMGTTLARYRQRQGAHVAEAQRSVIDPANGTPPQNDVK